MRRQTCYRMTVRDADAGTNETVEMWALSAEGARMMARDAGFSEVLDVRATAKRSTDTKVVVFLFGAVLLFAIAYGWADSWRADANKVEKRYPPGHPQHVAP